MSSLTPLIEVTIAMLLLCNYGYLAFSIELKASNLKSDLLGAHNLRLKEGNKNLEHKKDLERFYIADFKTISSAVKSAEDKCKGSRLINGVIVFFFFLLVVVTIWERLPAWFSSNQEWFFLPIVGACVVSIICGIYHIHNMKKSTASNFNSQVESISSRYDLSTMFENIAK